MDDVLEVARRAFEGRDWRAAHDAYLLADAAAALGPEDLERAWTAGRLLDRRPDCDLLVERAHRRWLEDGSPARAARAAYWLAMALLHDGDGARAGAWFSRATSLLDEHGLDTVERGLLLVAEGLRAQYGGDPQRALADFARAAEYAARDPLPDLVAMVRLGHGHANIALGRLAEGVAHLDEAMLSVTAGETSPMLTGMVYCAVIDACMAICDLSRAEEWTAQLAAWCRSQPDLVPFRGQCLVDRAQLASIRGDWDAAASQVLEAHRLHEGVGHPAVGESWYLRGELARLRGDDAEAEAAYGEAARAGRDPQPGLALLRLRQGQVGRALAASRRAVHEAGGGMHRVHLLDAHVGVCLGAAEQPDLDGEEPADLLAEAGRAAGELRELAARLDAPMLHATAQRADAAVALAHGDAAGADRELRTALATWLGLQAPLEAATTRVLLGRAAAALGDLDAAELAWEAAAEVFASLGAAPSLAALEAVVRTSATPVVRADGSGLTGREVEVLEQLATGATNRQIAEALVISEKTVARHLSNIFTKIDVSSRSAATAWAFTHGLVG